VHAVLHRLGVRDADDIDADGGGVRPDEAHGFDVGHAGPLAGNAPAERVRPEPAERRVIAGLHIHLNKSQRRPLILMPRRPDAMNLPESPGETKGHVPSAVLFG
jgi:hypothetical protein